jgi:hypothetical protein
MPILDNSRHEQFAQFVAAGDTAASAYRRAGYGGPGAAQSDARLLKLPNVLARVGELRDGFNAARKDRLIARIQERDCRLAALQRRWEGMKQIIEARAAAFAYQARSHFTLTTGVPLPFRITVQAPPFSPHILIC